MSIGSINGSSNWWQWRDQATQPTSSQGSSAASGAASAGNAIGNSGSVAAGGSTTSFMQALSADLQAMLTQVGSAGSASAGSASAGSASAGADASGGTTDQTAANRPAGGMHHHRHHHHAAGTGTGGTMQTAANQLAGEIGQSVQGGTLSTGQINQSASVFAADIMQALQAYGATAPTATGPSILT